MSQAAPNCQGVGREGSGQADLPGIGFEGKGDRYAVMKEPAQ